MSGQQYYSTYDISPVDVDHTVNVLTKILTAAQIKYHLSNSKSTNSRYIYLNNTVPKLKIRVSDHKTLRGLIVEKSLSIFKSIKNLFPHP